jgi:hypothetical protein
MAESVKGAILRDYRSAAQEESRHSNLRRRAGITGIREYPVVYAARSTT